jgi:hypothetical protein
VEALATLLQLLLLKVFQTFLTFNLFLEATNIYRMLYEEANMDEQGQGVITVNRLTRSSPIALPEESHVGA